MIAIPQIIAAMIIGVCYYMLAVAMTVYDGILSMIFQPVMGAIFSGIAIVLLLIVGLPIRLVKKVNMWWKAHWWLPFLIGSAAFCMMVLSWMPHFRVQDHGSRVWHDGGFISSSVGGWRMAFDSVCSFTLLSADALAQAFHQMNKAEPAHRPNPYKLALGLLTHPDRQLSGAGHAGRSVYPVNDTCPRLFQT